MRAMPSITAWTRIGNRGTATKDEEGFTAPESGCTNAARCAPSSDVDPATRRTDRSQKNLRSPGRVAIRIYVQSWCAGFGFVANLAGRGTETIA